MFRVYFQNPDGLKSANSYEGTQDICLIANGAEIDCLLLSETNTYFKDPVPYNLIYGHERQTWNHVKVVASSSDCAAKTWYQPGGTCSIMRGKWTSCCKTSKDTSGLGRWTTIIIRRKEKKKIAVINAYRVGE